MSKELVITEERVLEAAEQCPDVKRALKTLFPDAFKAQCYRHGVVVETTDKHLWAFVGDSVELRKIVGLTPGDTNEVWLGIEGPRRRFATGLSETDKIVEVRVK